MQNYGHHQAGYHQRPGSTTGFTTAPPPAVPPPYAAPQGYQSAASQTQSQWAPPVQSNTPVQQQQQWTQQVQHAGGYNPGVYGAMPGGYSQAQQAPNQVAASNAYSSQQDIPPPPPPKPYQIAAHGWTDQTSHGAQQPQQAQMHPQQNTGYTTHGQQGGYAQHTGHQGHATASSGNYFPSSQTPQLGQQPGSTYGVSQVGTYSTPSSAVAQHPPHSALSPNEHNPAYVPPSLSGQGVQSYVPANTNPLPGVYVPPPPDIPAWQPASHAPLHGGKFKYTKPSSDSISYNHGAPPQQGQGQYGQLPTQQPPPQYGQNQYPQTVQAPAPTQYGQPVQGQHLHGPTQQQGLYGNNTPQQPTQQTQYAGQPAPSYQHPQDQTNQHPAQQQQQPPNQWQPTPLTNNGYPQQHTNTQASYSGQQQTWQPEYQTHSSGEAQSIQAPRPVAGHVSSIPPNAPSEPSPQSQPVSPIQSRSSTGINFGSSVPGRTASVSSIALGAIHAQRAGIRTESPKPLPSVPAAPPPRDDATKFSALGTGGPSDWEHFGASEEVDDEELFAPKKDGRQGVPVLLDSVEVTSRVSPPQMQGEWPTPPVQPATSDMSNRDAYQPTPPPDSTVQRPPPQPAVADSTTTDNIVNSQPPQHVQNEFVMGDVIVAPLRVSRPSSQRNTPTQEQARHQPPPPTNLSHHVEFPPEVTPPVDMQSKPAPVEGSRAGNESWERLRADLEKETRDLRAEVEQLKIIIETTKTHAEYERNVLVEQMDTMKAAAEQAKSDSDNLVTERNATIERLQEDGEGKTDTINEKDAEIARLRTESKAKDNTITESQALVDDLKGQLTIKDGEISNLMQQIKNNQTAEHLAQELKQQLEAEKLKVPPKPTPAALVHDLDPWYAGSLERYITMLRSEAHEASVEDKIKVFTSFLKAESTARGIEYHSAPPPAIATQQQGGVQPKGALQNDSISRAEKNLSKLQTLPTEPAEDDGIQYSPGGRPIVQRMTNPKFEELAHPQKTFSISSQSTTVLTPTSSQGEFPNQTPTPVQSEAPQYKAYAPLNTGKGESTQIPHRQSVSSATPTILNPALSFGSKGDEVFFGASRGTGTPSSRPSSGAGADVSSAVPAPLSLHRPQTSNVRPTIQSNTVDKLAKLLPATIGKPTTNPQLEAIRRNLADMPLDLPVIADLVSAWEKSASVIRKKKDAARRKRQEESEEHTDQLFNDNEIAYAEIAVLEDEFKEQERKLKAEEDRDEYNSYVGSVFNTVYDGLQQQIKSLMDLYTEVEILLPISVSGKVALEGTDAPLTTTCLKLLEDLFELIEQRHDKVVDAVADRDRRYKKTEIQPLYAAGNIAKMKQVEQHFSKAEKDAVERARAEKAVRVEAFVRMVEDTVIAAVGVEQQEIQDIIGATRNVPASSEHEMLFALARETVLLLGESSKSLLELLNDVEIDVGGAILESQLADARAEKDSGRIAALEKQIAEREAGLKDELKRKEVVLEQDREEIEKAIKAGGEMLGRDAAGESIVEEKSEEEEKQERLRRALEAAKRRNGDL